jgi:hypothetical protein
MALTDIFLVQYLVQETEAGVDTLRWKELESGGYESELNGVRMELAESHSRAGAFLCLTLSAGTDRIHVVEPQSTSVFGRKYKNEDQARLAELLRQLDKAVTAQCERRRQYAAKQSEEIRQRILHRVVFGAESKLRSR